MTLLTPDWNEALKSIAAIAGLVTSLVTLAVAIITLRKVRMELAKATSGHLQLSAPQVAPATTASLVSVTLDDIAKFGKSPTFWSDRARAKDQRYLGAYTDGVIAALAARLGLGTLDPVELVEGAPIPLASVRRLRWVETLINVTVIVTGAALANWLIDSFSIVALSFRSTVLLGSIFIAFLAVRLAITLTDRFNSTGVS